MAQEESDSGEALGTEERRVQPLPPAWLESLIQEAPSCPAVFGCGGVWGPLPSRLQSHLGETTAAGWLTQPAPRPDAGHLPRALPPTQQARSHALGWAAAWELELALSEARSALLGPREGAGLLCKSGRVLGTRSCLLLSLAYMGTAAHCQGVGQKSHRPDCSHWPLTSSFPRLSGRGISQPPPSHS